MSNVACATTAELCGRPVFDLRFQGARECQGRVDRATIARARQYPAVHPDTADEH
jgi:hypothetical protein